MITIAVILLSFLYGVAVGVHLCRRKIAMLRDSCSQIDGEYGGLISYRTLDKAVDSIGGKAKIYVKGSRE